jgi:hypothetical protein
MARGCRQRLRLTAQDVIPVVIYDGIEHKSFRDQTIKNRF